MEFISILVLQYAKPMAFFYEIRAPRGHCISFPSFNANNNGNALMETAAPGFSLATQSEVMRPYKLEIMYTTNQCLFAEFKTKTHDNFILPIQFIRKFQSNFSDFQTGSRQCVFLLLQLHLLYHLHIRPSFTLHYSCICILMFLPLLQLGSRELFFLGHCVLLETDGAMHSALW